MEFENRLTRRMVDAWERVRWDIHEIVLPLLICALLAAWAIPMLKPLPYAEVPVAFYGLWLLWNILTANTYVHLDFGMELLFASIYFLLLLSWIGSTAVILLI